MRISIKDIEVDNQVLCRSKEVLWRINDDDTVLLLHETSGSAFLLSLSISKIWLNLEGGLPLSKFIISDLLDDDLFRGVIDYLIEKKLVYLEEREECVSVSDLVPGNLKGPFLVEDISFGGCDCSSGDRGSMRNVSCGPSLDVRFQTSIVF